MRAGKPGGKHKGSRKDEERVDEYVCELFLQEYM